MVFDCRDAWLICFLSHVIGADSCRAFSWGLATRSKSPSVQEMCITLDVFSTPPGSYLLLIPLDSGPWTKVFEIKSIF